MRRHEDDGTSLGAERFDALPAEQLLHGGRDFLLGAEQSPGELGRTLPDLGGVLAGEPSQLRGANDQAAGPEVLEHARAVPAGKGEHEPPEEGAHGVVHAQRQAGKQAKEESQGGGRRSLLC